MLPQYNTRLRYVCAGVDATKMPLGTFLRQGVEISFVDYLKCVSHAAAMHVCSCRAPDPSLAGQHCAAGQRSPRRSRGRPRTQGALRGRESQPGPANAGGQVRAQQRRAGLHRLGSQGELHETCCAF